MSDDDAAQPNEQGERAPDVCQPTTGRATLIADQLRLVYEPRVVKLGPRRAEIRAGRENPDVIPWGFWGGVLAALVAGYILFSGALTGPAVRFSIWNVLAAAALGILGLVLYRLGRRSTLEDRLLCELDLSDGIISWPAADGEVPVAVAFGDVQELTFAIVKAPVENSKAGTELDAATVKIRDHRDRQLPVVPASTSKGEAHLVARTLAEVFDLSVNYVGTGVSEWADRRPLTP